MTKSTAVDIEPSISVDSLTDDFLKDSGGKLGANIMKLRRDRNFKVEEISDYLDLPQGYYLEIEGGTRMISSIHVEALARKYDVSYGEVLSLCADVNYCKYCGDQLHLDEDEPSPIYCEPCRYINKLTTGLTTEVDKYKGLYKGKLEDNLALAHRIDDLRQEE